MKLNKWLYGVAALAMLAACSDRDVAPNTGGVDEGGDGYVGIKIQLPTVPSTRANDVFDDGALSEYAIADAELLLFQGSTMADATCTGVFKLKDSEALEYEKNPQITERLSRVANVSGIDKTKNVFALVIINGIANKIFTSDDLNNVNIVGKTIQGLQEYATENKLFTQTSGGSSFASNILMTNTPLSSKPGGVDAPGTITGALPVLVAMDGTTYSTEKAAMEHPAATIHVERAVGKITCSSFQKEAGFTVKYNGKEYKLMATSINWDMAQDLKKSYLVRNTNRTPAGEPLTSSTRLWKWNYASSNISADATVGSYRMIGHTKLTDKDSYYRPYFCQVPGYGKAKGTSKIYEDKEFNNSIMYSDNAVALAYDSEGNPKGAFYPKENTFPVDYMLYANTTRIGFWVNFEFVNKEDANDKLDGTKDFYISGADKSEIYFDDAKGYDPLTNRVLAALQDESKYPQVKAAVMAAVNTGKAGSVKMSDLGQFLDIKYASQLDKADSNYAKDGEVKIVDIKFKPIEDAVYHGDYEDVFAKAPDFDFSTILTSLNDLGDFYRYTGGKVFYEMRIKHFGNDLTPWSVAEGAAATTIDESYSTGTDRDANFLGRYGIVRNNWYDLKITKLSKLGYPEDPAAWDESWPGKPDDNKDQYIAVELRVLSWAKRIQEHEF